MTRAALLFHGPSVVQIYRDEWFDRYEAVYALMLPAAFFRHTYRCHLDPNFWDTCRAKGNAAVLDEGYFKAAKSALWLDGCRYTAPLVVEHALANYDEAHLFGFDIVDKSLHFHDYKPHEWDRELDWFRRVWSDRVLSFGLRAEP